MYLSNFILGKLIRRYLRFYFYLLLFFLCDFGSLFFLSNISASDVVLKKKEEKPCCVLGIAQKSGNGIVILEQMCNSKNVTTFHFRVNNLSSCCTYPPATMLFDDKGGKYPMLDHSGLPSCDSTYIQSLPNANFSWSFKRLKSKTSRISIIEAQDPVTNGMGHWAWRDISIKHCKL